MRVALIEYNTYHDEILPTLYYLFDRLGFIVDIYTSETNIRKNAFHYCRKELRFELNSTSGCFFPYWERLAKYRIYDLIVVNSIEPEYILSQFAYYSGPLLAIIHNAHLIKNTDSYSRFFDVSNRKLLVLSDHIRSYLDGIMAAFVIYPVYFGEVPFAVPQKTTFSVQGNIEFTRRNYSSILDAVFEVSKSRTDFYVSIVGRDHGEDGQQFRDSIKLKGLDSFFRFHGKDVTSYKKYFSVLKSSDFILPLVDTTKECYQPYFKDCASSSIPISIGLEVPCVIHQEMARVYDMVQALTYDDGNLADAMVRALSMSDEEHMRLRADLQKKKEELLTHSLVNIKRVLGELGVPETQRKYRPFAIDGFSVFFLQAGYESFSLISEIYATLYRLIRKAYKLIRWVGT